MSKKRKFLMTIAMAMVMLLLFSGIAVAAPKDRPPEPTEGIKSDDPLAGSVDFSRKAEPGNLGVQAIYLISGYGSGINNLGGGTVSITGYTDTYSTVSSVTVTLYLQKWDGSQWVDLTGQSYTSYSTASVTGTKYIAVAGGAYYRTRALHNAKNGSTTDSSTSTSSYIYVP